MTRSDGFVLKGHMTLDNNDAWATGVSSGKMIQEHSSHQFPSNALFFFVDVF
jgi:hypothetical protein